jgi:hypothetical protein
VLSYHTLADDPPPHIEEPVARYFWNVALLVFVVVASSACGPLVVPRASQDVTQTIEVGQSATVTVDIDVGSVTIERGRDGRLDVAATKSAAGQAALNSLYLEIGRDGDRVRVVFHKGADTGANQTVALRIAVPSATTVTVSTGAGAVTVAGTAGGVTVKSGLGPVSCRDVTGALDLAATSGDIEVWGADGPVRASAVAGAVKVEGKLSGDSRLSSGTSGVTVRLYPDAGLRISAHGLSLRQEFGWPVSPDHTQVSASLGDGSRGALEVTALAGRVELLKR